MRRIGRDLNGIWRFTRELTRIAMIDITVMRFIGPHHEHHIPQGGAIRKLPVMVSDGSGTVGAKCNPQTNELNFTVTYTNLSGAPTAGHFHGPAAAGENAGVAVPLTGDLASPITGSATLTAPQVAELMAGKWSVNLHTAAHPDGEIRGQVTTH